MTAIKPRPNTSDSREHHVIPNRDGTQPYLIRFHLLALGAWRLKLHVFVQGDSDRCLHDHPWTFYTLILLGGYFEETDDATGNRIRKWYGPGRLLHRPAEWKHRVILDNAKPCVTMVLMLKRRRAWGFFTRRGWVDAVAFFGANNADDC